MSVNPEPIAPIPAETVRVAKAAFPKGNPYLTFRDVLRVIFGDADFVHLFSHTGQPAVPPWRLALITLMQFRENLSDRQAAESVRSRIDWKYWFYRTYCVKLTSKVPRVSSSYFV